LNATTTTVSTCTCTTTYATVKFQLLKNL
jgi:hypothetical protein